MSAPSNAPLPVLTLLGKPDCHLCHEMRQVVEQVVGTGRVAEQDIRDDPALEHQYLFEIPVLVWNEHEVARHRVTEEELRLRLEELNFPV